MRTVERAGLRFDVVDRGPEDAPAVVLLHGFPQSASSWDELGPRLNAAGYRTLAPDQRGYSRGARPRGRRAYRMSELVGDVLALLDAAGGAPVHLAGHDWGAVVAWTVAARHPERLRTLTALSVPHPAAFLRSLVSGRQAVLSWYMYVFQVPGLPELLLSPAHPRRRERLVRWLMASGQTEARARRDAERMAEPGALTAQPGPISRQVARCSAEARIEPATPDGAGSRPEDAILRKTAT